MPDQSQSYILEPSSFISPHGTFMRVPAISDAGSPDIGVLGLPYDIGTDPHRIGSRNGPQHIRNHSMPSRPFLIERSNADNPIVDASIVDFGDLTLTPGESEASYTLIRTSVLRLMENSIIPVTFGGDGSVTLPQLRAASAIHPDLVALHIDSHTDAYPVDPKAPYSNATTFTHAATERLLDTSSSFHLGMRGTSGFQDAISFAENLGYPIYTGSDLRTKVSSSELTRDLINSLGNRPVYVCWDMDIFDPSVAPGVCTPEWGGWSAADGIDFIRALPELNIVSVDINTVNPLFDPTGATGSLAARVALEFLYILTNRIVDQD